MFFFFSLILFPGDCTFGNVASLFERNFQLLKRSLEQTIHGVSVCNCEGGYFLTADVTLTGMNDMEFVERLVSTCKVAALPMRLFYSDPTVPRSLVRFAVCKKEETIDRTVVALQNWK